jgi:hypothetical protein
VADYSERHLGWFRAMRGKIGYEIMKRNRCAFLLMWVIGERGQYSDEFNQHNLNPGEAFLGDFENYGMSEREYRTAKRLLEKWGFATFKATSKGTVGTLADTRLFSIFRLESDGQKDRQLSNGRRTGDGQATTTKNSKNKRTEEQKGEGPLVASDSQKEKKQCTSEQYIFMEKHALEIEKELKEIRSRYDGHESWKPEDTARSKELRQTLSKIKKLAEDRIAGLTEGIAVESPTVRRRQHHGNF